MTNDTATEMPRPVTEADGLPLPGRAVAVAGITIPAVLSVLDGAMLTVALPRIGQDLAVSAQAAVWLVNAYQVTAVICLLPMTFAADRFGYARTFGAGILVYALASVLAAGSEGFAAVLMARVLQGLGSAGVMGCAAALLRATYPAALFGTGVAFNTAAVSTAAAAGPSAGALLLTASGDWRALFLIGVPFSLLAWGCTWALPKTRGRVRPLRAVSVGLNAVALGLGVIALSVVPENPVVGGLLLLVTAAAWVVWVRVDRASATPLLPVDLFRIPAFSFAIAASASMFAAQSAALIALPFFLMDSRGLSVLQVGTMMTVWPVCAAATSIGAIRLLWRLTVATLCMTAAGLLAAGLVWVVTLPTAMPMAWLAGGLVLGGVAVGCFQAPNMHAILSATPRSRSGAAGSVQAIARVGGAALGASLVGLCFAVTGPVGPSFGLLAAGVLALAAFGINAVRRGAS